MAPPTQGTWRSNDYVSAVRLVECKFVVFIQQLGRQYVGVVGHMTTVQASYGYV